MDAVRSAIIKDLENKVAEISKPDFVRRHLCRFIPECRPEELRPEDIAARMIQNDGTGAATVEIEIRGSDTLYCKLYPDESGLHAHQVLKALWEEGFDATKRYQVSEPLCFIDAYNLLVTRQVRGECLDDMLAVDADRAMAGVREAAKWLLRLHRASIRIGHSDHVWYMVKKLSERLSRVLVSCPEELEMLMAMLERLSGAERASTSEVVQVHGQFRPIHVFLSDEAVSVIDLDRSHPSDDPSQDLGEFVHRLRTKVYRKHGLRERADILTDAFLSEYAAARPAVLERVPFYRGFRIIDSMCNHIRRLREDGPARRTIVEFYAQEFEEALSRKNASRESEMKPSSLSEVSEEARQTRSSLVMEAEFVGSVLYPTVFGKSRDEAHLPACEIFVAQEDDRGTGRVTVGYRFGADELVFGKLYPSKAAPHSYEVMQRLRRAGFGDGPYQVAEPLAFLAEHNFLVTRSAPGVPLMDSIGEDGPAVLENVRRAARWLVHLHKSPLRIGPTDSLWRSMRLLTIVMRLTQAAAKMPFERDRLLEKIDRLSQRAEENREFSPVVQTHGSFHHEHLFVSDNIITVIDFDKSFPADPARDLAEFLTMLRRRTFQRTGSLATAHEPTRAFLAEYAAHLPANMKNLAVYWGAAILPDLFRYKKKSSQEERMDRLARFCEEEYDAVLSGELIRDAIG